MTTNKNNANNNMSNNNETKVMCPVCGTEFAIGEHEHKVKNAISIGKDSGLGEVYLPVSKRGQALESAGIDTTKYFSINLPTGGSQLMKMTDGGVPVAVTADDPIMQQIVQGGTVPNRNLFRRWVMSQVFHGLQDRGGFSDWLKWHGYKYQWEMLVEELRVQAKLYGKDMENYEARNRWFNRKLCVTMAKDYVKQLRKDAFERPTHKCKGVPYIIFSNKNYFVSDIEKKLVYPVELRISAIESSKNPQQLYNAVLHFWQNTPCGSNYYHQCAAWKDAYKGMGAYATMQNLLRFHGCKFPKDNDFYTRNLTGLQMLENAAISYHNGEGWRLFGLMKQMLDENGINIDAKMREWAKEKKAKNLKR